MRDVGGIKHVHVLAMRILAFSSRLGELTAIVLSRMKPTEGVRGDGGPKKIAILTFIEIGIRELSSDLLDDLDVLEVC